MRSTLVLTVKNEGAFLLEWLAHHRACGFSDVLAFSNDCADGTDAMLDRLAEMGWLTHIRNDGPHQEGPQWAALKLADRHPLVREADWVLFADIDEFVNIHVGSRRLPDLLAALPQADAIPLTWRLFGNAGVVEYQDHPVTETFVLAAPATLGWPWRAQMVKTLHRPQLFRKLGVHRPKSPVPGTEARWYDGSGREVDLGQRLFSDFRQDNYRLVQMNHYALGAVESFLVKCDRGRANREAAAFDMGYFVERNLCAVDDRSIQGLDSAELRQELQADSVLKGLHDAAVAWRKTRFVQLMAEEPWRAFFARMLMIGPSRALTAAEAARITAHRGQT
jgi:hypothetical protein